MKKLQIILAFALLSFLISCSEEGDTVKPPIKETDSIKLTSVEGTNITKNIGFTSPDDTEIIISFHTQITNSGNRDLLLYAKMELLELDPGQASYFCWGDIDKNEGTCYPPLKEDFLSDRTMTVKAGETTPPGNFLQYLSDDLTGGEAKIRYIVYEKDNEDNRDTIVYNISVIK
ncbi:MAG: hypothetical protein R2863_06160 [Candidatus Kapaibacterium sp.]|nr:hypothetical protein [Ignavibacteriota bacterium]